MIRIRIDRVLSTSYVIRRVVNPHKVVSINPVPFEMDTVEFSSAVAPRASGCNGTVVDWRLRIQHGFNTR
jgi:hypothetical protein